MCSISWNFPRSPLSAMFSSGGNPLHRRFFAIAQNDIGRSRRLTVILSRSEESDRHTIRLLYPLTTDIFDGIYYLVYTISNIRERIYNPDKTQDIQPTGAGRSVLAHRATHASVRGFGCDALAGAC